MGPSEEGVATRLPLTVNYFETRWILVREESRKELTMRLRIFSGSELRALLLEAGFARVDLYGSLQGAPYDRSAKRLVAVAR